MDKSISIFEALNLRYQFCELVKTLNVSEKAKEGNLDGLRWFVKNGYRSNRFKENYNEAKNIAKTILNNV